MTAIDIPGYVIRREVGVGGMASVYLALQTSLDREVALKIMSPALAADPTFSKRFLQEARMLASLAHPNIVQVYDVGVTQSQVNYFSMQYLANGDFAQRVRLGWSEKDLLRVLEGVANALGYAHLRGYVHRDVAPGNILFDASDTPILTDFGIARAFSQTARITSAGISVGTSHYMSPEQARGSDVDARSDLYGLGVLTWFGLTGKPPYEGADGFAVSYAHVFEPIPRLPPGKEHWQTLIDKALAKDPAERYQSAEEFIAALAEIEPETQEEERQEAPTRVLKRDSLQVAASRPSEAPTRIGVLPGIDPSLMKNQDSTQTQAAPGRSVWPWVLAGVGALLIGSVGYLLLANRSTGVAGKAVATATVAPSGNPQVSTPSLPTQPDRGAEAASQASTAETAPPVDALGDELFATELDMATVPTVLDPVAELVRLARSDLAGQRLTNPVRKNAFERFSLALMIDAKSKVARQGIFDVAKAYVDLAEKSLGAGNLGEFVDYLAKAEQVAGSVPDSAAEVAQVQSRRQVEVGKYLDAAQSALADLDSDAATVGFEKAMQIDPGNQAARSGLQKAKSIGKPGYVFRDKMGTGTGPELVVVSSNLAFSRRETTRGEFASWWRAEGRQKFSSAGASCRDRESIFRSSRKRDWSSPDITQDDSHPVVCVSFAQATAYANWISTQTGHTYRLPTPSEWEQAARNAPIASCTSANLADATYNRVFETKNGADCNDGFAATAPAGRFPAVSGVFDLDGNVREWVAACGKSAALTASCRDHGTRGRGWASIASKEQLSDANDFAEDVSMNSLGFRLVRELVQ